MNELASLPNIGAELSKQLGNAGINSINDLRVAGSKNAWLKIRLTDPSACYMRLCSLEGAIRGIRWHNLPDAVKKDLKEFYNESKK